MMQKGIVLLGRWPPIIVFIPLSERSDDLWSHQCRWHGVYVDLWKWVDSDLILGNPASVWATSLSCSFLQLFSSLKFPLHCQPEWTFRLTHETPPLDTSVRGFQRGLTGEERPALKCGWSHPYKLEGSPMSSKATDSQLSCYLTWSSLLLLSNESGAISAQGSLVLRNWCWIAHSSSSFRGHSVHMLEFGVLCQYLLSMDSPEECVPSLFGITSEP